MKVVNVVGARPNFMKIAPIMEAMGPHAAALTPFLVHTGQHYDKKMSRAFFHDLGIPAPDVDLGVGSGSHAEQTGRVMVEFEKVCLREKPDIVIVVGDVNSTLACAITARKLWIPVGHVEAGMRSGDMRMPEEINRKCTDAVSDWLYTTDHYADEHLRREGAAGESIVFVGNTMVDTLLRFRDRAAALDTAAALGLDRRGYATVTLHRPSNVDDGGALEGIVDALVAIARDLPVVFPVHPRTRKMIDRFGLGGRLAGSPGIRIVEPMGYLEFLHLNMHARLVITDSGGIQEETTVLGVPCLTLRENTERPITCDEGTNELVGSDTARIVEAAGRALRGEFPRGSIPEKWDGRAGERIVRHLLTLA